MDLEEIKKDIVAATTSADSEARVFKIKRLELLLRVEQIQLLTRINDSLIELVKWHK